MSFHQKVFENGPSYKDSNVIYLNFLLNKLGDASLQFNRQLENEIKINREHLEERNKKLEAELREFRQNFQQQLSSKQSQLTDFELKLDAVEKERDLLQSHYQQVKELNKHNDEEHQKKMNQSL